MIPIRFSLMHLRRHLPYGEDDRTKVAPGRLAEVEFGDAMEFSHSLADLIGGQTAAGLAMPNRPRLSEHSTKPIPSALPT